MAWSDPKFGPGKNSPMNLNHMYRLPIPAWHRYEFRVSYNGGADQALQLYEQATELEIRFAPLPQGYIQVVDYDRVIAITAWSRESATRWSQSRLRHGGPPNGPYRYDKTFWSFEDGSDNDFDDTVLKLVSIDKLGP